MHNSDTITSPLNNDTEVTPQRPTTDSRASGGDLRTMTDPYRGERDRARGDKPTGAEATDRETY